MSREILVSVYGTLRKGCGNDHYLRNAEYKGEFMSEPVYNLFNLGGYPGLREGGNTSVKMEVYAVNKEEALRIDGLEGYSEDREPYFYDKKEIETPFGIAGVYTYVREVPMEQLIKNGDWTKRYEENAMV